MTIYEQLKDANVPTDHHESDLYALVTAESTKIVKNYKYKSNVERFISDGKSWYDIPFAYDPFWSDIKKDKEVTK